MKAPGHLAVIGLGPGAADLLTPRAAAALDTATQLVGYVTYLARVPARPGHRVAVVSSGDAGVFAMASAVFEAMESGPSHWRSLDVEVIPAVSAMLAAAARIGAPLGHDFCVMSLSDNLKPWHVVASRLTAAAAAGFVLALYNPRSQARPGQLADAFALLRPILPAATPVVFATAISRPDERIDIVTLDVADGARADMRTLVLIGSAETRRIERPGAPPWIYAPRGAAA
jgi:precorrin-3B C17-methyltransferase